MPVALSAPVNRRTKGIQTVMSIKTRNIAAGIASVVASIIFLQTLFFKFTGAPETQHIFQTLAAWGGDFGIGGAFAKWGPAGPIASGFGELVASLLLLSGTFIAGRKKLQLFGGLMAEAIMTVAIFFHLFTPLGIEVQGDGGFLFGLACLSWLCGAVVVALRWDLSPFAKTSKPAD